MNTLLTIIMIVQNMTTIMKMKSFLPKTIMEKKKELHTLSMSTMTPFITDAVHLAIAADKVRFLMGAMISLVDNLDVTIVSHHTIGSVTVHSFKRNPL